MIHSANTQHDRQWRLVCFAWFWNVGWTDRWHVSKLLAVTTVWVGLVDKTIFWEVSSWNVKVVEFYQGFESFSPINALQKSYKILLLKKKNWQPPIKFKVWNILKFFPVSLTNETSKHYKRRGNGKKFDSLQMIELPQEKCETWLKFVDGRVRRSNIIWIWQRYRWFCSVMRRWQRCRCCTSGFGCWGCLTDGWQGGEMDLGQLTHLSVFQVVQGWAFRISWTHSLICLVYLFIFQNDFEKGFSFV